MWKDWVRVDYCKGAARGRARARRKILSSSTPVDIELPKGRYYGAVALLVELRRKL